MTEKHDRDWRDPDEGLMDEYPAVYHLLRAVEDGEEDGMAWLKGEAKDFALIAKSMLGEASVNRLLALADPVSALDDFFVAVGDDDLNHFLDSLAPDLHLFFTAIREGECRELRTLRKSRPLWADVA